MNGAKAPLRVTKMYALIDISNQMLEDSAFDHAGASLRKVGLAAAINEMLKRRGMALSWPSGRL